MEQVVNDHGEVGKPRKDGTASDDRVQILNQFILNGPRKLQLQ